jgi:hypothetical protein
MRYISKWIFGRPLLTLVATLALAACGGGGGGGGGGGSISLSAQATSPTAIALTWTAPSGGVSVSPYVVARNDAQATSTIGSTAALSFNVAGLSPGTQYCFVIKNPLTGNTMSNTACVTTPADNSAPTMPTGLTAIAISPAEVDLSWSLSSDNDRVAGYNVFRDGVLLTSLSSSAMVDNAAVPGATHCYTVSAYDASGNESAQSTESCSSLPADIEDPTVPTNVTAELTTANGRPSVALAWTPSTDDGVISYYRVYRNSAYLADAEATTYDDSDLQADTSYCYAISAVDAAGKESLQSDPACAREGFQTQALGEFGVRFTAIALDSSDTPQIVYKQNIFDAGLGEIRIPLSLIQLQSGQAVSPQLLEEGTETFFFSDAYRVGVAVDASDVVHLAHKVNRPPFAEEIQYLQVSPGSTVKSTIQQSMNNMNSIALAVDSTGAVHACYGISSTLYYANNIGGTWSSSDVSTLVPGTTGYQCDIAIGGNDSIHISLLDSPSHDLLYLSNASGSWTVDTLDAHSGNPVNTAHNTSIATDSTGNAHIAYFHDYEDNDLEYATNASGVWITSKIDSDGDVGYDCDLALDSAGRVHIVYEDHTDSGLLKYATNGAGLWTTDILSSVGNGNTSIAIDLLDRVHVTYTDANDQLTYTTNRD